MENNWDNLDGLPPVKERVIFKHIAPSKKHLPECEVIILAHVVAPNGQPCAVYCSENCNGDPANGIAVGECFRPIKSDREKAIESAKHTVLTSGCKCAYEALYDAGLLRLPEDK